MLNLIVSDFFSFSRPKAKVNLKKIHRTLQNLRNIFFWACGLTIMAQAKAKACWKWFISKMVKFKISVLTKMTLHWFWLTLRLSKSVMQNLSLQKIKSFFRGPNNARSSDMTERILLLIDHKFSQFQGLSGHFVNKKSTII